MLYQLNYRRKPGRAGRIRTDDPLLPKQMRYQAALQPDSFAPARETLTGRRALGQGTV